MPMRPRKYKLELFRIVEEEGAQPVSLEVANNCHYCLRFRYRGKVGRLHTAGTPSDYRHMKNVRTQLRIHLRRMRGEVGRE